MTYKELRDEHGHLVGRYDPKRKLLEIKHGRVKSLFDLADMREDATEADRLIVRKPFSASSR